MKAFNLLMNTLSEKQAKRFIGAPSHALLITAPAGSGKLAIAQEIAAKLLRLPSSVKLQNYPYFTHIMRPKGKQDISIDSVRGLTKLLRLKTPGDEAVRRVVIIEDAQDLSEEAQNAMLKMLEEPAADRVFILTAVSNESLLPTIVSRTQRLPLQPVSLDDTKNYFANNYDAQKIEAAWRLSGGAVGLMCALLKDDSEHPLKAAIDGAKDYLRKDKYQRLILVDSLSRDKVQLTIFLEALSKLLAVLHHGAVNRLDTAQAKKILASRKMVHKLRQALEANTSPKLIALELSLNLV